MFRLRRLLVLALVGVAFAATLATAQIASVYQTAISGSEAWSVAQGAGGPSQWIAINTVRGSQPITTQSGSGAATATATPGTLCWVSTAPTTWGVTLPVLPADGTIVRLCSDTTLTTLVTVTAGTGDTLTTTFANQTVTANASFPAWQFKASTRIWYRIQ